MEANHHKSPRYTENLTDPTLGSYVTAHLRNYVTGNPSPLGNCVTADTYYMPFCGLEVIEEISGHSAGLADAYAPLVAGMGGDELLDHERAAVDALQGHLADIKAPAAN